MRRKVIWEKQKKKPELPDCFVGNGSAISDSSETSNRFN